MVVELQNLIFYYPHQDHLLDISSFKMDAGEQVFLMAPSGSGKSTLINLITGILKPLQGKIYLLGNDMTALKNSKRDRSRGDLIGLIFQQFNLIPYLSIMENVIIPTKFSERKREQTLAKYGNLEDAAMHFLRELDLQPNLWSRRVDQLSVGQQQRVAAARAFMGEPPLIIADEPTSSLDFAREKSFLDLLKRQALSSNVGLLYVSHNQMLANNFSKIVKLDEINETLSG